MENEIWIFIEHCENTIENVSLELLGEAKKLARKTAGGVAGILIGAKLSVDLQQTSVQYGAQKLYIADDEILRYYNSEIYTHILTQLAKTKGPKVILFGATPNGNDLAPRVANRLGVASVSDCTDLKLDAKSCLIFSKPILGAKAQASFVTTGTPQIATVLPDIIGLEKPNPTQAVPIEHIAISWDTTIEKAKVLEFVKADPATIDIAEAETIVAGGRGVGGKDKWSVIEEFATIIGGAVAGSRMAMDANCIPMDRLVGQTGKNVRPKIYLAVGISGTSQHVIGLKGARKIIAINKDRYAPLMKQADLAVVADLHELLPALTKKVLEYRSLQQTRRLKA
jgi:electron transfer flavoprotein alpha subunit